MGNQDDPFRIADVRWEPVRIEATVRRPAYPGVPQKFAEAMVLKRVLDKMESAALAVFPDTAFGADIDALGGLLAGSRESTFRGPAGTLQLETLLDAERALTERARATAAAQERDDFVRFHVDLAPRGPSGSIARHMLVRVADPDPPRAPRALVPAVQIDCESRQACIGEWRSNRLHLRPVRWTARDGGAGTVVIAVTDHARAEIGTIRVYPDRSFDVTPALPAGSTRLRKARQVLYPLARAWCQQPQRGPRGRKAHR